MGIAPALKGAGFSAVMHGLGFSGSSILPENPRSAAFFILLF